MMASFDFLFVQSINASCFKLTQLQNDYRTAICLAISFFLQRQLITIQTEQSHRKF